MHHGHYRLVSQAPHDSGGSAREDRASLCSLAVEIEKSHASSAAGPRRFSSVEYPVSIRDGFLAARPFPRGVWRTRGRRRLHNNELLVLLLAAKWTAGRSF